MSTTAETIILNTSQGLQELVAEVAAKANAADVYTKAQVDAGFLPQGEIEIGPGHLVTSNAAAPSTIESFANVAFIAANGAAQLSADPNGQCAAP